MFNVQSVQLTNYITLYIIPHNLYTNLHCTALDLNDVHKSRTCIHAHLHVYMYTNLKPICLLVFCVQIYIVRTRLCILVCVRFLFGCVAMFCLLFLLSKIKTYSKRKYTINTQYDHRLCVCALSPISQCILKINTFT